MFNRKRKEPIMPLFWRIFHHFERKQMDGYGDAGLHYAFSVMLPQRVRWADRINIAWRFWRLIVNAFAVIGAITTILKIV